MRVFTRTVVIFVKVSNDFDIIDIDSLAVHLQLDLSSKNSEKTHSEFSRTAHYMA